MELDFRGDVDFIIITPDRKSFMQSVNGKIEVKGVQNKYKGIQKVYDRFIDLNFFDKKILFEQMHKIKRFILDSNDVNIFKIKTSDDLEIVRCKDGEYEYTDDLPTNEIAKYKYFKHYIKPFLDQIFLTFNN